MLKNFLKSVYLFFFSYFGISSKKRKSNLIEDRLLDDDSEVAETLSIDPNRTFFNGEENDVRSKDADEGVFLMRWKKDAIVKRRALTISPHRRLFVTYADYKKKKSWQH